jgi:hypothetical protein
MALPSLMEVPMSGLPRLLVTVTLLPWLLSACPPFLE